VRTAVFFSAKLYRPRHDSRFIGGIPIFQRSDGGILIVVSEADQGAAEQENRDEQKPVVIADLIGIDIRDKKVNKKGRGKAESSHGNALDKQKPILHHRKILGYTLVGK
jgi:hypothetical protein